MSTLSWTDSGGFGIYELYGKSMEAIRVNQAYYELMGYPNIATFNEHSINVMTQVFPPDVDKHLNACYMAVKTGKQQKVTTRRYKYDGKRIRCLIKHIGGTGGKASCLHDLC